MLAMSVSSTLLRIALLGMISVGSAQAQDPSDLDSEDDKKSSAADRARSGPVREINRGLFMKANVGGAFYLGNLSGALSPGTSTSVSVGQDFLDRERTSMAWEFALQQGIHQGAQYQDQVGVGPYIQGDTRTYTIAALMEWSTYPARRWGIGARAGAGVMIAPLLMNKNYYGTGTAPPGLGRTVLQEWGLAADPGYHNAPHPTLMGGPNIEYYTKLSHFSVGLDIDVFYAIGFDLGAAASGNMKYTF
jgi:hypothetical protein